MFVGHGAGAGTAENRLRGTPTKDIQLLGAANRQIIFIVLQHGDCFAVQILCLCISGGDGFIAQLVLLGGCVAQQSGHRAGKHQSNGHAYNYQHYQP